MLKTVIYFLTVIIITSNAEYVPVYMWGSIRGPEHVRALHKTSEASFKATLLQRLKNDPLIIVFAEQTLSPEDLAHRDFNGDSIYPHLKSMKEKAVYEPSVQSPLKAVKELEKKIVETSVEAFKKQPYVPDKNGVLIINLNDAKDDEHRFEMLKRHDEDVISIYNDVLKNTDNVLAIYTAYHSAWIAPDDITIHKKRSLLAEDEKSDVPQQNLTIREPNILMYLKDSAFFMDKKNKKNLTINDVFKPSVEGGQNSSFTLKLKHNNASFNFEYTFDVFGYWYLNSVTADIGSNTIVFKIPTEISAPMQFSYHCANMKLNQGNDYILILPGFQVQPTKYNDTTTPIQRFGNAYDCVGFTSVPIWSGLFVTFMLLAIMTFGLTMIMDIKTMDRFDDAKGKTITINASE